MSSQREHRRKRSFFSTLEPLESIRLLSGSAIVESLTQAGAYTINGTTTAITPSGVRLTNGLEQDSSVWFNDLQSSNHYTASFNFALSNPGGINWADGLTFAVVDSTKNGPHAMGSAGGGIGYEGLTGYAIEFDTFYNAGFGDPNYPHVGLDLGGSVVSSAQSGKLPFDIRGAGIVTATITFASDHIVVDIAKAGGPTYQVLSATVPAKDVPASGRVGITAATWAGSEKAVVSDFDLYSAYTPAQVSTAYGLGAIPAFKGGTTANGSGQTIAIIGDGSDPNITSDVAAFDKQFGLTAPVSSFLTITNELGNSAPLPPVATSSSIWPLEEAMDVEWAHALAPGAKIDLVESNDTMQDYLQGALTASTKLGASVVSMSTSQAEYSTETTLTGDNYFTNQNGVTYLAATGDTGAPAQYPAASPYVVAVGGTTLSLNPDNSYAGETGWKLSGGGYSKFETAEPSYQLGVQKTGKRSIPDVAFDADSASGVVVYDSYDPKNTGASPWMLGDGTSLATPSWAALIAIIDQGRVLNGGQPLSGMSQTLPALYDIASANYHENLGGNNGTGVAGSRYSLVTGLGSPIAASLVPAMVSWQPVAQAGTVPAGTVGTAYNAAITAVANTGTAGYKTLSYAITSGTLPAGLKITTKPNELDITGMPTAAGTLLFNVTATDLNGFSVTNSVVLTIKPK